MTVSPNIVPKLSVMLFIPAALLLLAPSYPVLVLAAAVGTGVGVLLLYLIVDEREALRFTWLLAASLIVAYAGGTLSTWFNSLSLEDFTYLTKQRPLGLLCGTLGFVYISTGIVLMAGRFEPPIFRSEDELPTDTRFSVALSSIGLAVIILAYLTEDLGYEGVKVDALSQRISVLGAIATLIAAPLAGLFGFMYGRFKATTLRLYSILGGSIVILSIIPTGRRQILLALIVLALGYSLSGALRQRSLIQKMLLAMAILSVGFIVSAYFFALRLSVWELGPDSSFSDQLSLAFDFMTSTTLEGRFNTLLYDNVRERTFVLGYLADLIEATRTSGPLYGEALLFYLKLSVPSVLDPSKVDVLTVRQIESFAHPKLGLPVIDQANTILTDGVTDFGVIGGFVYLLGMIAILCASIWVLRKFYRPVTFLITSLAFCHLAMRPEITLSEYFVAIRNLMWIAPLIFAGETIWESTFEEAEPHLYDMRD